MDYYLSTLFIRINRAILRQTLYLGKGSFGQVIKAFDHKTQSHVALKIVRNEKRFHRQAQEEIRILEALKKQVSGRIIGKWGCRFTVHKLQLSDIFTFLLETDVKIFRLKLSTLKKLTWKMFKSSLDEPDFSIKKLYFRRNTVTSFFYDHHILWQPQYYGCTQIL